MIKKFTFPILVIFLIFSNLLCAQTENPYLNFDPSELKKNEKNVRNFTPNDYDPKILYDCITEMIDMARAQYTFTVPLKHDSKLDSAAKMQADFQAFKDEKTEYNNAPYRTLNYRLKKYGLSGYGFELVNKTKAYLGDLEYSYYDICLSVVQSILKNIKTANVLLDKRYTFMGFGFNTDALMRNAYTSIILGNDRSFNLYKPAPGVRNLPYSKGNAGLRRYDEKICKKCHADPNLEVLSDYIKLKKDGSVYLICDNYKNVKKLIGKDGDAIAIDFVQHSQYECDGHTVDYEHAHRGFVSKPITFAKIYDANENTNTKSGKLIAKIASLPDEIDLNSEIDLNILVLKEGNTLCRTILNKHIEAPKIRFDEKINFLKDHSIKTKGEWVATPETDSFSVSFPYTITKTDYYWNDTLLKRVHRPNYTIQKIKIIVHNSLNYYKDAAYQKIQEKRLAFFKKDLAARFPGIEILTTYDFDWEQFKKEIVNNGEYYDLSFKTMEEAAKHIRNNKTALKELEAEYLLPHRTYEILFDVIYQIDTKEKEETFAVWKFNQALSNKNRELAMSIENYLIDRIEKGLYTASPIQELNIPATKANQPLLNNKLYMLYYFSDKLTPELSGEMYKTYNLNPANQRLLFNTAVCNLYKASIGNVSDIAKMQAGIDRLYSIATIPKEQVNNLNLEFQFKVIHYLDTVAATTESAALRTSTFAKIKEIRNPVLGNWQNAYKLAFYFVKNYDYSYALSLLDPFLDDESISEDFIFFYVSLAAHREETFLSGLFTKAVQLAATKNPARLCGLFDKLPICVMENEDVKAIICETCNR